MVVVVALSSIRLVTVTLLRMNLQVPAFASIVVLLIVVRSTRAALRADLHLTTPRTMCALRVVTFSPILHTRHLPPHPSLAT